jgi:hypothetical protein
MPKQNSEAEPALNKVGQRSRQGFAKQHPLAGKSLETVKDAVREQYEQEQKVEREKKPVPDAEKDQERQEPGHDQDR